MGPPDIQLRVDSDSTALAAPGVQELECAAVVEPATFTCSLLDATSLMGRAMGFRERNQGVRVGEVGEMGELSAHEKGRRRG